MVQLYYQKEQGMIMQLNATHANLREQEDFEGTKIKGKEVDQNVVRKILIIESTTLLQP
jgi:hypothetical protein